MLSDNRKRSAIGEKMQRFTKQLHAVPSSRPGQSFSKAAIRLVVASDYPMTRIGLESIFTRELGFVFVACGASRQDVTHAISNHAPDILILEQAMRPTETLTMLRQFGNGGTPHIILLTEQAEDDSLSEAIRPCVDAVLSKTVVPESLVQCVRDVHGGRRSSDHYQNRTTAAASPVNGLGALTRRQTEVVRAAASGLSNKELGELLGVSEGTIKNHLHAIYERLQLDGRLALLLYAKDSGIPLVAR